MEKETWKQKQLNDFLFISIPTVTYWRHGAMKFKIHTLDQNENQGSKTLNKNRKLLRKNVVSKIIFHLFRFRNNI